MAEDRATPRQTILIVLIFVAIMLNYVDRTIFALLKPDIEREFGWSDRDYSHMVSAFQIAAAVAFLGMGWFLDRVGLRRGFAAGVGGWSLAAIGHAAVSTIGGFVGVRAVLGAFEAAGTPAAVKSAAAYFPATLRAKVIGIGNMAPNVGSVAAPLVIPALALAVGWRGAFVVAGALGLVWVAVWALMKLPPEQPAPPPASGADAPPGYFAQLRDRRQWAIILAKALTDQVWWFFINFLPDFFYKAFAIPKGQIGLPVALVYAMAACGAFGGGWLFSRLLARCGSVNAARKRTMLAFACLVLPLPLAAGAGSPWAAALILGLGLFAHQGFSTSIFGFTTDVFPARVVATAVSIGAFAGNLGGVWMSELAGWSLTNGHGYAPMFAIASVSYLAALGVIHWLVPRIPQPAPGTAPPAPVSAH